MVRRRTVAQLSIAGLLASGTLILQASAAQAATCPDNSWQGHGRVRATMTGDAVNIRTGPSTSCTSRGQAYRSHSIWMICYKGNWDAIWDETINKRGWVSSAYVDVSTHFPC
jgi:uncharacterized protein YraI